MAYVSNNPYFTKKSENGVSRIAYIDRKSAENSPIDIKVSKLANLLGISFPANKEKIKDHLNRLSPSMGNRINDVLEAIQNNLNENVEYNTNYKIEKAAGLVTDQ